jgi:hypothetical protein
MLTAMDTYAQYIRFRQTRPLGLSNRRLAAMLGDFVYETSSAEDESRRYLEMLHGKGMQVLTGRDLDSLERFTSEHNREERRGAGVKEEHFSWGRVDGLSRKIIRAASEAFARTEPELTANSAALDRMFATTSALREFRNQVAHRTPSDGAGRLHFYRQSDSTVSPREIWGWTEVAASYWSNLTSITNAISMASGVVTGHLKMARDPSPLQWPPACISIHGLLVIERSGISVPEQRLRDARSGWIAAKRRWKLQRR